MSFTWRLFQLTQGYRGRLVGAASLGLGASVTCSRRADAATDFCLYGVV
jgi:hypothetical protein